MAVEEKGIMQSCESCQFFSWQLSGFKNLNLFPHWDISKTSLGFLRKNSHTGAILRKKTCQVFHRCPCSTLGLKRPPIKTEMFSQDFWVWSEKLVRPFWTMLGRDFEIHNSWRKAGFWVSAVEDGWKLSSEVAGLCLLVWKRFCFTPHLIMKGEL